MILALAPTPVLPESAAKGTPRVGAQARSVIDPVVIEDHTGRDARASG